MQPTVGSEYKEAFNRNQSGPNNSHKKNRDTLVRGGIRTYWPAAKIANRGPRVNGMGIRAAP